MLVDILAYIDQSTPENTAYPNNLSPQDFERAIQLRFETLYQSCQYRYSKDSVQALDTFMRELLIREDGLKRFDDATSPYFLSLSQALDTAARDEKLNHWIRMRMAYYATTLWSHNFRVDSAEALNAGQGRAFVERVDYFLKTFKDKIGMQSRIYLEMARDISGMFNYTIEYMDGVTSSDQPEYESAAQKEVLRPVRSKALAYLQYAVDVIAAEPFPLKRQLAIDVLKYYLFLQRCLRQEGATLQDVAVKNTIQALEMSHILLTNMPIGQKLFSIPGLEMEALYLEVRKQELTSNPHASAFDKRELQHMRRHVFPAHQQRDSLRLPNFQQRWGIEREVDSVLQTLGDLYRTTPQGPGLPPDYLKAQACYLAVNDKAYGNVRDNLAEIATNITESLRHTAQK